ncbi:hypothetical protein LZ554_001634 [Drepanopeziza brunnea f. sp. 'monogermtubi']|nr:hypothetical protein LZ554_001634 [Drepanopeziza brunnea f. sp. 'monogermtubi']
MASPTYNALPQTPTTPFSMNYNDSIHKPVDIHVGSPTQYFGEEGIQSYPQSPAMSFLSEKDRKLKSRIRYLRLLSRLAGTAIAITIVAQEGQTLYAFYTTHTTIRSGRGPWAKETQLWSSLLMFCLSLITALLGVGIVIAYYFSIKAANTIAGVQLGIVIVVDVGHLVVWIAVAVAYRVAKNKRDLWGWACSPIAGGLQPNFEGIVDFGKVCDRGQRIWELSIAKSVVNGLAVVILVFVYRRTRTKKEIRRLTLMGA